MPRLDLSTLGEFGLIGAIRRRARNDSRDWLRGIGDDAAILRPRAGNDLVVTSDALVEGVHFRWSTTDERSLAAKALAVNLSDLGAMGARPLGFLLNLALPGAAPPARLEGFVAGLLAEARRTKCPLVGGDTVAGPVWMISIAALGEVRRGRALLRSGARRGDRVLVTGYLGGSALGLRLLESTRSDLPEAHPFVRRQIRPRPPHEVGARLARTGLVTAAIDLSDGLVQDLGTLAH